MNEYLVITWADSVPVEDGLADAARDRGGQLLAAGPVHDASELDSRPAPAGLVIARFSTEEAARSWFDAVLGKLDGTTLLAAGATAPVWWPPEKEPERPEWSRRGELPAGRFGLFVNVWAEITDPPQFFDYSTQGAGPGPRAQAVPTGTARWLRSTRDGPDGVARRADPPCLVPRLALPPVPRSAAPGVAYQQRQRPRSFAPPLVN